MTEKGKRPVYEPPRARDLSAYSVSGDGPQPMGVCEPLGGTPYSDCVFGDIYGGGTCNPGPAPTAPKCTSGSNALVGCMVGSQA